MQPPLGRLWIAAAMAGYDGICHTLFVFWPPLDWVQWGVIFWPRFLDDASYNGFWAVWHLTIVALVVAACWSRPAKAKEAKAKASVVTPLRAIDA